MKKVLIGLMAVLVASNVVANNGSDLLEKNRVMSDQVIWRLSGPAMSTMKSKIFKDKDCLRMFNEAKPTPDYKECVNAIFNQLVVSGDLIDELTLEQIMSKIGRDSRVFRAHILPDKMKELERGLLFRGINENKQPEVTVYFSKKEAEDLIKNTPWIPAEDISDMKKIQAMVKYVPVRFSFEAMVVLRSVVLETCRDAFHAAEDTPVYKRCVKEAFGTLVRSRDLIDTFQIENDIRNRGRDIALFKKTILPAKMQELESNTIYRMMINKDKPANAFVYLSKREAQKLIESTPYIHGGAEQVGSGLEELPGGTGLPEEL